MSDDSISLNKYISSTGICSRRAADKFIEAKRVRINGKIAIKGNRVFPGDQVTLDNNAIGFKPRRVFIMFNKPPGITCTTDRNDPDNIIDFIGHEERIFPIGRLDKASTGLIFLTNEGDMVNKILRKENKKEKEYIVVVNKPIDKRFVERMSKGIPILGTKTLPCEVVKLNKSTFKIILTQGLNRQIRRMVEYLNYKVVSLKRVRIMHIELGNLKEGRWRKLNGSEWNELKNNIDSKHKKRGS